MVTYNKENVNISMYDLLIQINICLLVGSSRPCHLVLRAHRLSGALGRVRLVLRHRLQSHLLWDGKLGGASWF